ncbi:origin recognition complex subunit 4 [Maniola jurtina]|uniref:origin recognition complex subunit 4 n=1 Tax=Maniola jurtina TaxID=191418 RepID=UPI001E686CEC|nr:origin recognition complex subunit 4 [Maniola jurtina]
MDDQNPTQSALHNMKLIKKYLKIKIMEDNISFTGRKYEREHVYDLIARSVLHGESHSALIIGPRGSGKTTLLNWVLHQVSNKVDLVNDAYLIKLNGLIHHDDKLAFKYITAQMRLESAVGDRVFGSFAEKLSFILQCLTSGADRQCKTIVFILEEFDMFCHGAHRQTLLYNLFNITHTNKAPVCVLGITSHLNVMELLDKRVKSRFSHRNIFIYSNETEVGAECPVTNYKEKLVQSLSMPLSLAKKDMSEKRRGRKSTVNMDEQMEVDGEIQFCIPDVILTKCKTDKRQFQHLDSSFLEDWNAHIQSLANDQKILDSLEKLYHFTGNEQTFKDILFQTVSKLLPNKPYIDTTELCNAIDSAVCSEHRVKLLQSLSILELSLVIAMVHGMAIFDGQPMNFEMVLHRYTKFANTNSSNQSVPRPVVLKAFEHLELLQIITPSKNAPHSSEDACTSSVQKEYKLYALSASVDDVKQAIASYRALPTEISHWFNNSID